MSVKVVFIVNEQAGGGNGRLVWSKLQQELSIPYQYHLTTHSGHAVLLARTLAQSILESEVLLLLAVGGDGTVHEVIEGAAGYSHIYIGAVKAGSGNDFARGFSVFTSASQIEKLYTNKQLSQAEMDLGQISIAEGVTHSFVNNAGLGFDAYITTTVNQSKLKSWLNKIKLGRLSYLLITVWAIFTFKRFNAEIVCDGKIYSFRNVWFTATCNQPFFGGGMKISPQSQTNDQQLEMTIVHQLSKLKLLLVFATVFWGKHERFKEVTMLQGKQFHIKLDRPTACHVDGEGLGVIPSASAVICQLDQRSWKLAGV